MKFTIVPKTPQEPTAIRLTLSFQMACVFEANDDEGELIKLGEQIVHAGDGEPWTKAELEALAEAFIDEVNSQLNCLVLR